MRPPQVTERQFTEQVRDLARTLGWRRYHVWLAKHSPAGFPDEVLVKPPRIIFAELKTDTGRLTEHQEAWICDLQQVAEANPHVEVHVWRPSMLEEIAATLSGRSTAKGNVKGGHP